MPGERFTVVIDYDPVVYSKGVVHALFERRESDGFSVCLESATTYETKEGGDSLYHFDKTNPTNVLGNPRDPSIVRVSSATLPSCWALGSAEAASFLTGTTGGNDPPVFTAARVNWRAISQELHDGVHPDMLRPFGKWIGVHENDDEPAADDGGGDDGGGDDGGGDDGGGDDGRGNDRGDGEGGDGGGGDGGSGQDAVEVDLDDLLEGHGDDTEGHGDDTETTTATGSTQHRRVWLYDFPGFPQGITLEKATKLFFGPGGRKSTERMARVMDENKKGTKSVPIEIGLEDDSIPVTLEAEVSPLLFIICTKSGIGLGVGQPLSFSVHNVGVCLLTVTAEQLADSATQTTLRVMRSVVQGGTLIYRAQRHGGEILMLSGMAAVPFNPMLYVNQGLPEWRIQHSELELLLAATWSDYKANAGVTSAMSRLLLPSIKDETALVQTLSAPSYPITAIGTESLDPEASSSSAAPKVGLPPDQRQIQRLSVRYANRK